MSWIRPAGEDGPPPGHMRGEDAALVAQAINGILTGRIGEQERRALHEMLAEQVRHSDSVTRPDCFRCADVGLLFLDEDRHAFTYRCTCTRGLNDPRAFPVWRGSR